MSDHNVPNERRIVNMPPTCFRASILAMDNDPLEEARKDAETALFQLRDAIKNRGLSLREIDRRLGLAPGQTSNKLAGRRGLDLGEFLAIARAGGVEIFEILPGKSAPGSLLDNMTPQERLELQEFIRETVRLTPDWDSQKAPASTPVPVETGKKRLRRE